MQSGRMLASMLLVVLALFVGHVAAFEQPAIHFLEAFRDGTWVVVGPPIFEPEVCRISDGAFELYVFGGDSDVVKEKFTSRLRSIVDALAKTHNLTSAQKQKLHLAGRGDIQRWFDRVEKCRMKFQSRVLNDDRDFVKFCDSFNDEAKRLKAEFRITFQAGSLLSKTLHSILRDIGDADS